MKFGVKSDRGMVREHNEDSCNIIAGYPGVPVCFIIADGMGGHNAGEIASKMAVDYISKYIIDEPALFNNEDAAPDSLCKIIEKANQQIYENALEYSANSGMGTTLVAAVICGRKLIIGHIGDSRAYVIHNGAMQQITTDHSFIEELIKNGSLTREEAENHPKKNVITRALGCSPTVEADIYQVNINENDIFLLCTDGLTNMLSEEEIRLVAQEEDPDKACSRLVHMANEKGGDDNSTVIIFRDNQ